MIYEEHSYPDSSFGMLTLEEGKKFWNVNARGGKKMITCYYLFPIDIWYCYIRVKYP